jgi:hypothetical protein
VWRGVRVVLCEATSRVAVAVAVCACACACVFLCGCVRACLRARLSACLPGKAVVRHDSFAPDLHMIYT